VSAVQGSVEQSCSSVYISNKELFIVLIQTNPSTSLRAAQIVQQRDSSKEIFHVQQTFMHSVFEHCMHTNKSCHIVQTFESTGDAQSVYAGYPTHLQQLTLDRSSHYYALMINGIKAIKHFSYHGNPKS
jgi:hypothetical protein